MYELFRCEHDLTFIFPAAYKQLQAFLLQQERASKYPYSSISYFPFSFFMSSLAKHPAPDKTPSDATPAKISRSFLEHSSLHIVMTRLVAMTSVPKVIRE